MIGSARARASRANGRKSRGPKTPDGKACASRNAQTHGLNLPVLHDPARSREVEELARRIAGKDADAGRHELACRIAEAQIDLVRVRLARLAVFAQTPAAPDTAALARLDRYERRARARRKSAIRVFDDATCAPAI